MSRKLKWRGTCGAMVVVMLTGALVACDRSTVDEAVVVVEPAPVVTLQPPADTAQVVFTPGTGFDALHDLLQQQVAELPEGGIDGLDGGQSGVAALVRVNNEVVYNEAFGYERKWDAGPDLKPVLRPASEWIPATVNTMWDMASVTKVLSTNFALQHLVYTGELDVNALVSQYIPEYQDYPEDLALLDDAHQFTGRSQTRVIDLLHHVAGQFPDPQYFNDDYLRSESAQRDFGYLETGAAYDAMFTQNLTDITDRAGIINAIVHTPLVANLGDKQAYSDVDYMLLGLIIEAITGMPQDEYVETNIYAPLGLTHTMYRPLDKGVTADMVAATEVNGNSRDGYRTPTGEYAGMYSFSNMRTDTIQGAVHDEKAYYNMAQVSGHAGLFSTTEDAGILMQLMLNGGTYNGVTLWDQATTDLFLHPAEQLDANGKLNNCYALGWWVNGLDYLWGGHCYGSYFSNWASNEVFGHQGWAGPLVFADPTRDLVVVYMRNRPHNPVVGPSAPNSFMGGGTTANTYGAVSAAVYEGYFNLTEADFASDAINFGTPPTETFTLPASGPERIPVEFADPVTGDNAWRIDPRIVQVLRVPEGTNPDEVSASTATILPLYQTTWSQQGGSYYINATEPGDYYLRIWSNQGSKIMKWATVTGTTTAVTLPAIVTPPVNDAAITSRINGMSIEDKVATLFVVTPEMLLNPGENLNDNPVVDFTPELGDVLNAEPVGGIILFARNIKNPDQLIALNDGIINAVDHPFFLTVDEEGGLVARIGNTQTFNVPRFPPMASIGATHDPAEAFLVGNTIGGYLRDYGFNLDMAPVADIFTNPLNTVIGTRAFGSDPTLTAEMVAEAVTGFQDAQVAATVKHFPGHGDTAQDSHEEIAYTTKTLAELESAEFLPFEAAMEAGTNFVMVGHIGVPEITGNMIPSSLNPEVITGILRDQLGWQGLVITDALDMGAIADNYPAGSAAVAALVAGADMLEMPENYYEAKDAVLAAVEDGTLTEARIDESLRRIFTAEAKFPLAAPRLQAETAN
ncbi:MAG: serine hydrolase [Promicromonosporaceae bacterium]|nr:serine hydrolase [Promicromonosporaceae bacterium]